MKKIGIIGGAGPLASSLLYETIIRERYLQALPVPEIYLINFPFTRGMTLEQKEMNENIIQEELTYCMSILIKNGVEIGVIACNTLHLYLQLLPKSPIPFLSLPKLILEKVLENGHRSLLVLGTQCTCHSHLYHHPDVTLHYTSRLDQSLVEEIIDRILAGKMLKQDSERLGKMISRYYGQSKFEGVVLGCTELPVLHHCHPIPSLPFIYDSIKIPARKLGGAL